jgi:hypothetical protein
LPAGQHLLVDIKDVNYDFLNISNKVQAICELQMGKWETDFNVRLVGVHGLLATDIKVLHKIVL